MVRISEKDKAILRSLSENARTPYTKIAEELGVTEATVRKRIRKLEEAGVIERYTVEIDPKKLGYSVVAFVGFDIEPNYYVRVISEVKKFPEIKRLYSTTGDHMFMAECWFKNRGEMEGFIRKLESVPGMVKVCPAIVVEKIK